jgi:Protein of unknown function (DUF3892)
MAVRITCVSKPSGNIRDQHEAISALGWINEETGARGTSTRLEIYEFIKTQGGTAYVIDQQGNKALVGPRENAHGTRFVQTHADGIWTDDLLSLPGCP